jgi:hypothetical protein
LAWQYFSTPRQNNDISARNKKIADVPEVCFYFNIQSRDDMLYAVTNKRSFFMDDNAEKHEPKADKGERITLEYEAYRKHFDALFDELGQIKELYDEAGTPEDKLLSLSRDVSALKGALVELKDMFLQNKKEKEQQAPPVPAQNVWAQPMPTFQPVSAVPMFHAPSLPYIQTPNYAPIMPTINNPINGGK